MRAIYRIAALLVLGTHLLYSLAAMFGGLAVYYNVSWLWFHLPIAIWAVLVNLFGWYCPLTSLEQKLLKAGRSKEEYAGGFLVQYFGRMLRLVDNSSRNLEVLVAAIVFFWNTLVYAAIFLKYR